VNEVVLGSDSVGVELALADCRRRHHNHTRLIMKPIMAAMAMVIPADVAGDRPCWAWGVAVGLCVMPWTLAESVTGLMTLDIYLELPRGLYRGMSRAAYSVD
jgi:hypothetical protein